MDETFARTTQGLGNLVERLAPTLFEVGSWVFGGLIALNLVVLASLITVGPVDRLILFASAAFAGALPLNVAGICLLRLAKDAKRIGIEDLTLQAFQDARFPDIESYFPSPRERERYYQRQAHVTLGYATAIAALSTLLTLAGLVAALWHMAWWIGVTLLGALGLGLALVAAVLLQSRPPKEEKRRRRTNQNVEQARR